MSSPVIDFAELLRQKRLQDLMSEADRAVVPGDQVFSTTKIDRPPVDYSAAPLPSSLNLAPPAPIVSPLEPREFQAPNRPLEVQPMIEPMRDLIGYEKAPIETVPRSLQPVAPIGRDLATPASRYQTPEETRRAIENVTQAAQITEDPITKKRKFAAMLAGIGGGFLGGPAVGMGLYGQVAHAPYNAKVESIMRRQGLLNQASKLAEGAQKLQMEGDKTEAEAARDFAEEGFRRGPATDLARAQQEHAEAQTAEQRRATAIAPQTPEALAEQETRLHPPRVPKVSYSNVTMKDGTVVNGAYRDSEGRMFYRPGKDQAPVEIDQSKIAKETEQIDKGTDKWDPFTMAAEAKRKLLGRDLSTDELTKIYTDLHPKAPPSETLEAIRLMTLKGKQREEQERGGLIKSELNSVLKNHDHEVPKEFKPIVNQAHLQKTGFPSPQKLTPDMEKRENPANVSLEHASELLKIFKDNKDWLPDKIGIVTGRLNQGQFKLGAFSSLGLTQKQKDILADVFARYKSLKLQEMSSISGGRLGRWLGPQIDEATPKPGDNYENSVAKLKTIQKVSNITLNEVAKERYGQGILFTDSKGVQRPRLQMKDGILWKYDDARKDYVEVPYEE